MKKGSNTEFPSFLSKRVARVFCNTELAQGVHLIQEVNLDLERHEFIAKVLKKKYES